MAESELQGDADVQDIRFRLTMGLKCCRSVISSYRSLLKPPKVTDALADEPNPLGVAPNEPTNR